MDALQQHPQAEIVGLVDAYKGRLDRALSRVKGGAGRAKIYPTHRELLAEKSIDAVVVAIPDHLHKAVVVDALRAGKDVYCEKPLTYTPAEGLEIIAAAAAGRRIVQVGSQGVSSDLETKAKKMIQAGKLGRITMIHAAINRNTASGAWIYPIPPDASPETVNWAMFQGSASRRPFSLERFFRWRCYQEYSGGIATDLFVHLCTAVNFLMDAKMPARAMAMGELYRWKESRDVPDTLNAILEYPEGFTVNLSSSFNNELNAEAAFQVLGTEGSLTIGGDGLVFYPENAVEDNRWIVDAWAQPLEDAYYKDPKVIAAEVEPAKRPRKEPEHFKDEGPEPTVAHFGHFFDSVRTRQPYWENEVAGHHAAACAHMVNLSAQERRLVAWDFAKDLIAV
jgi:predicted dehydrogenase